MNPKFTPLSRISVSAIMSASDQRHFCRDYISLNLEMQSFTKTILPLLKRIIKSYSGKNLGNYTKRLFILNDLRFSVPDITEVTMKKAIEFLNKIKTLK